MTMRVRAGLTLIVAVAIMGWAGCDHYNCGNGPNLGASCTASGGGLSSGGTGTTGGGSITVLAYYLSNNEVGSVELNSSAALLDTPNFVLPTLPTTYTTSGMAIAQEQFVYVPYGSSGQLFAWSIDSSTGALTALTGSPFSAPDAAGIAIASQATAPIITNSAGTFLYMADATDSRIDVYQIDSSSGIPTLSSQTTTVIPPWNLSIDGLGRFLYVTEGNSSGEGQSMAVYSINSTTGALSVGTTMTFPMWQVQGEPTGQFMIGVDGETGFAHDQKFDPTIYTFSINQTSGALTQVGAFPTPSGNGPTGLAVSPNGQFVYDFNLTSSTGGDAPLEGFALASGALTPLAGSPFSALTSPSGGYFDQSGDYLFYHTGGTIGTYNINLSTGIPTETTQAVGIGSGEVVYPWAVTDPE